MNAQVDKLTQALRLLREGHVDRAEVLCREVIRRRPGDAQALHLLGVVALQGGEPTAGIELLRKSVAADPQNPLAYGNLGNAYLEIRQPDAALLCYQRALQLKPDFAGALYGQGNALVDLNRAEAALTSFDQALLLQPDYAEAHNNRGNTLLSLGRVTEALESYRRALALRPDFALALDNCARALRELQRPQEVLAIYERMLVLRPDDTDTLYHRANAYLVLGHCERALADYDRVLERRPGFARALCNRGWSLIGLDRHEEAVASLTAALALDPQLLEAADARSRALRTLRRHEAALADVDHILKSTPGSPDILYRRAVVLRELYRPEEAAQAFATVLNVAPEYEYALGNLLHARLQVCDWTGYQQSLVQVEQSLSAGKHVFLPGPFVAVARTAEAQLQCARLFVAQKHSSPRPALWNGERYGHERIRVAYISADFREHPVSILLAGVLEQHDPTRFETIGICLRPQDGSPLGERVQRAFSRFIDVSRQSDQDIATLLRKLEVDIAVDLMGFSGNGRTDILTRRPAPVQVNYLGYTATTALPCIDYVIADPIVIPPVDRIYYSEKVAYLPESYQPGDSIRAVAEATPTRAQAGLPDAGFVFCCFNAHYKINPDLFYIWMRLLAAVPDSVLWLAEGRNVVARNLRQAAVDHGIPVERLVFAPRVSSAEEHLARYRAADLFLDTLPFNAHVTASDALWAGLPVLTSQGSTFAGRVASSLLTAVGLPELVTTSLEAYEAQALRLANTPTLLEELRSRLDQSRKTAPLFNTHRYCRHLEAAYTLMWRRAEAGEAPTHLAVPALPSQ